jgi:hypothetical protein
MKENEVKNRFGREKSKFEPFGNGKKKKLAAVPGFGFPSRRITPAAGL